MILPVVDKIQTEDTHPEKTQADDKIQAENKVQSEDEAQSEKAEVGVVTHQAQV